MTDTSDLDPTTSGLILIQRMRNPWADRLRRFTIVVDGVKVGRVAFGGSLEVPVSAGTHVTVATIDWARSRPLTVDVSAGQTTVVECRSRNALFAIYWATVGSQNYVRLTTR